METKYTAPTYYIKNREYEPKDVITTLGANFFIGNAIKYLARAGKKPGNSFYDDISKAKVYIQFEINRLEDVISDGNHAYGNYRFASKQVSVFYYAYQMEVIKDWGYDPDSQHDNEKTKTCRNALHYIFEYFNRNAFEDQITVLSLARDEVLGEYLDTHENEGGGESSEFKRGYNHALCDTIEYLDNAHGGDTFVSIAELKGHMTNSEYHPADS